MILRSGLDRLELNGRLTEAGQARWREIRDTDQVTAAFMFCPDLELERAGGGRNFVHRWTDERGSIAVLQEARSDEQQKDNGDIKIDLLQAWLWENCDTHINQPSQSGIDRINALLVSMGVDIDTVRVARVDFCCDVTAEDAHKWRFPAHLLKTRTRNHRDIKVTDLVPLIEYDDTPRPRVDETMYTGFVLGAAGNKGQGMLRVYRKDVELQNPKKPIACQEYVLDHALDVENLPCIWRIEFELSGSVLTEHKIRKWCEFSEWRPAMLRRLAGVEKASSGYRILRRRDRVKSRHQIWRELTDNIALLGETRPIEKLKHDTHLENAVQDAKKAVEKHMERLQALLTVAEKQEIIKEGDRRSYLPVVSESEVARRISSAQSYYRNDSGKEVVQEDNYAFEPPSPAELAALGRTPEDVAYLVSLRE